MAKKVQSPTKKNLQPERLQFGPLNYGGFALGLLLIIIGFFTLSQGSMTLAPLLLVLGYCIVIPVAIVIQTKERLETGE